MLILFSLLCATLHLLGATPQEEIASSNVLNPSSILPTTLRGEAEVSREETNPEIELAHDIPSSEDEGHPFDNAIVTFKDSPMDKSFMSDYGLAEKDGSFDRISPEIANMISESESYNGAEPLTPSKLMHHKALDYTHFNNETFI